MSCTVSNSVTLDGPPIPFNFSSCNDNIVTALAQVTAAMNVPVPYLLTMDVNNATVNILYSSNGFYSAAGSPDASVQLPISQTSVVFTTNNSTYILTFMGVPGATINLVITAAYNGIHTGSGQVTPLPSTLDCNNPYYSVDFTIDNIYLQDVAYTAIIVGDCHKHKCGLGEYTGFTQSPYMSEGFTLFYLVKLNIGDAIIGEGTLTNKINTLKLTTNFILYTLLKFTLGRLLFKEFDLKWLYRCNYRKLLRVTSNSIYKNTIPYLSTNSGFEVYYRDCC